MKRVAFSQTIRTLCLLSLAGFAVFLYSPKLHAADELLKKKTKPQPAETETPDKPKENKLKLPETKLELPDPDKLPKAKPGNQLPVEPIIKEMQRASKLISEQKTGKETQQIQREVVRNLEELIQLIESSPGKTIQRMSSRKESESSQQSEQKQAQKDQQGKNQQNGEQLSQGPAKKSTDRQNQGKATSGQLADRNAYIKDAWGHLPPAMRQQLLNIYTEKFLPRYEDQVKRYYEALAEKNRQQR
ncbi:hypothetical protein F1728_22440 [Gimesia benthica]|uniref:Uncharacterized protein n=1 Tax=Gimesia benthica TaxID=2608982 RepID=A0A6I6AGQ8_9PLAN|nr:hypothetical protein [Gimesia benthica]QGQ25276.1 hypothetical protein F1728_22440 [Gimesia benthica]